MTPQDLVWSEPPPSGWGATGGKYDELFAILRANPGRWAEVPDINGSAAGKFNLSERRRGEGFSSTTRRMPDGSKKIWIIFNPPAS